MRVIIVCNSHLRIYPLDMLGVSSTHSLAAILRYWSDPQCPIPEHKKNELGTKSRGKMCHKVHLYLVHRPSMNATPIAALIFFPHNLTSRNAQGPAGAHRLKSCELISKNGQALKAQPWQPSHFSHLSTQAGDSRHISDRRKGVCGEQAHLLISCFRLGRCRVG